MFIHLLTEPERCFHLLRGEIFFTRIDVYRRKNGVHGEHWQESS